jgi:hypothetical protein
MKKRKILFHQNLFQTVRGFSGAFRPTGIDLKPALMLLVLFGYQYVYP